MQTATRAILDLNERVHHRCGRACAEQRLGDEAYCTPLYDLTRDELRHIVDPKDVYGPEFPGETSRVLKETAKPTAA